MSAHVPARPRGGTAAGSRKFTLAGVTAWIKLIEEDTSVALFGDGLSRRPLVSLGSPYSVDPRRKSGSECPEPRRSGIQAPFLNFAASSDPLVAFPAL